MKPFSLIAAIVVGAIVAQAPNEDHVSQNGFRIQMKVPVKAKPDIVYESLIKHIGEWWDKNHTFSGDPANMSIEARPHGWFIETLPNGGFVRHFEIVYLKPNETIRFSGGMGPLQGEGLVGTMTINFKADGENTIIDLVYNVGGYKTEGEAGLKAWAPPVKQVIKEQMERLRDYAEKV